MAELYPMTYITARFLHSLIYFSMLFSGRSCPLRTGPYRAQHTEGLTDDVFFGKVNTVRLLSFSFLKSFFHDFQQILCLHIFFLYPFQSHLHQKYSYVKGSFAYISRRNKGYIKDRCQKTSTGTKYLYDREAQQQNTHPHSLLPEIKYS